MPLTTVNPAMIGQTSTGAASLTATGSAAASLVTAAGTALSANSSGYVTTPFQPAFFAISSGVITPGSGLTKVSFASVTPNISSSFSTSTSRFTAPVAGTYFFTGLVTYDSTGSASYVGCLFYRNGSNIYSTYNGKASGQYGQVKNSLVITLSAGDYMELYTDTNSGSVAYEGGRTYFMGYLLG